MPTRFTPFQSTRRLLDASALLHEATGLLQASAEALKRSHAFVARFQNIEAAPEVVLVPGMNRRKAVIVAI